MHKMYQQFRCSQIILPEHRRELEKLRQRKQDSSPPPCADEQEKERWDELLQLSLHTGRALEIIWADRYHPGTRHRIKGTVQQILSPSGQLLLQTSTGTLRIPAREVLRVEEL